MRKIAFKFITIHKGFISMVQFYKLLMSSREDLLFPDENGKIRDKKHDGERWEILTLKMRSCAIFLKPEAAFCHWHVNLSFRSSINGSRGVEFVQIVIQNLQNSLQNDAYKMSWVYIWIQFTLIRLTAYVIRYVVITFSRHLSMLRE